MSAPEDATETLPAAIANLPRIEAARLPVNYEAAKTALATCEQIDECKDWADKAMALAAYARQANDDELLHTARRIRLSGILMPGGGGLLPTGEFPDV